MKLEDHLEEFENAASDLNWLMMKEIRMLAEVLEGDRRLSRARHKEECNYHRNRIRVHQENRKKLFQALFSFLSGGAIADRIRRDIKHV